MKSNRSKTSFVRPSTLVLVRDQKLWLCWSAIGGTKALDLWNAALNTKKDEPKSALEAAE